MWYFFKVGRRHYNDIALELHHKRDEPRLVDIVCAEHGIVFLEDCIGGIARYVVNGVFCAAEQLLDDIAEILIISAALGIEYYMHYLLIILREEFLIVLFSESLVLLCLRFFSRRIASSSVQVPHSLCTS